MTGKIDDPLMRLLFGSPDRKLQNLKLLRGDARDVSERSLRDEVHSALLQVQMSASERPTHFPDISNDHPVTIDTLNSLG